MVDMIERMLDISCIRCNIVGNAEKRGISGGQKKRVSIAMELVKEAALFFLDGHILIKILVFQIIL